MASTKDRQRALERARYLRVQEKRRAARRAAQARRRKVALITAIAVVVVGGGLGTAFALAGGNTKPAAAAKASASASSTSSAAPQPTASETGCVAPNSSLPKKQSWKSEPAMTIDKSATYTMTIKTNCGTIVAKLDTAAAPHTVNNFAFLAANGYFNDSYCHRLTTSGIYVLQCGDPTATATTGGTGGPGYTIPDENLTALGKADSSGDVTYPAGTLAMANTGQANSGGSQFFLVYKATQLPPSYTVFGTITSGLDVVQTISLAGSSNTNGSGDGYPLQKVQIDSLTVTKS